VNKWLIIGGSIAGAVVVGVIGGLYLAGLMVRKTTEEIVRQIQTMPPPKIEIPKIETPPPPPPPPPSPPPQLPQTQNQQQAQTVHQLPRLVIGGFIPNPPPPPPPGPPPCTGTCPAGTIPMTPGCAGLAGCTQIVTTVCGVLCVQNGDPCIPRAACT